MNEKLLADIGESVLRGKLAQIGDLVKQALAEGIPPLKIIQGGLSKGMAEVGVRFKAGDYFLPEVMVSAKTMSAAVVILEPLLTGESRQAPQGKVVIGTVAGDVHDIGKNIVAMMLRGSGFEVIDLGVNISADRFIESIRQEQPDILGMCALLSTTMPAQRKAIEAITSAGLRDQVKIMVGGAPVQPKWAEQIGADGYAPDAVSAVDKVKELLGLVARDD